MVSVLDMREFYTAYELFSKSIPNQFKPSRKALNNFINHIQDAALLDMAISKEIRKPRCFMAFDNKYSNNPGFVKPIDILNRLNWVIENKEYFGLETAGNVKAFDNFVKVMKKFARTLRIEIMTKLKLVAEKKELKVEEAAKTRVELSF